MGMQTTDENSAAAQTLRDHKMALTLIEFGERKKDAEALAIGYRILAALPVNNVNAAAKKAVDEKTGFAALLKQCKKLSPGDTVVTELAKRAQETAKAAKADGALGNKWDVKIDSGKFYRLYPYPRFPAHALANVHATAAEQISLQISVRQKGSRNITASFSGTGSTGGSWPTNLYEGLWDIRVYNVSSSDGVDVSILTSTT